MKTNPFPFLMAGLLFIGCSKKEKEAPKAAPNSNPNASASGNPLTAPVDYLGAVVRAKQTAQTTVGTVGLQKMVDLFHAQEGRLPKDLNELVSPNYAPALPVPPAGMKFDYNAATGQVKLVPK